MLDFICGCADGGLQADGDESWLAAKTQRLETFFFLVKEALEGAWEKKKLERVDEGEAREDEVLRQGNPVQQSMDVTWPGRCQVLAGTGYCK